MSDAPDEEDKKRHKMQKKLRKILLQVWQHPGSDPFRENHPPPPPDHNNNNSHKNAYSLKQVGQSIEDQVYCSKSNHRQGWEEFARDLGMVYNSHISRSTPHAKAAKEHLKHLQEVLQKTHESLSRIAGEAKPTKKRKEVSTGATTTTTSTTTTTATTTTSPHHRTDNHNSHKRLRASPAATGVATESGLVTVVNGRKAPPSKYVSSNPNAELAQREVRAMDLLCQFLFDRGAADPVALLRGFRSRVARKRNQPNKYDVHFFSPQQVRFRSMLDVGRHFHLVHDDKDDDDDRHNRTQQRKGALRRRAGTAHAGTIITKEQAAEKKRIRRELDKLRKSLQRATKNLDDHHEVVHQEEEQVAVAETGGTSRTPSSSSLSSSIPTRWQCAATRKCDLDGFPGIPSDCIPDVLQAWDFCATFQRVLSLTPMENVDDFAAALAYVPPEKDQIEGDDVSAPPVYVAETHLALLKLLFDDRTSEDWWWSVLETSEEVVVDAPISSSGATGVSSPACAKEEIIKEGPVYRINVEAMMNFVEESLVTRSWVQNLDVTSTASKATVHGAIRAALKVVANPWVKVYLHKARKATARRGLQFTKQALKWLVLFFQPLVEASDASALPRVKTLVLDKAQKEIATLSEKAPAISELDIAGLDEEEDEEEEEEDEESEDEDEEVVVAVQDKAQLPASPIPPRPLPTLVDMLLPPTKPTSGEEFINAFTWAPLAGATAHRILHRKKRILNEIDDALRVNRERDPILLPERRRRESEAAQRILTECAIISDEEIKGAIDHLCLGKQYLELSFVQRLCILRLLIEAAYDTDKLYETVDKNYKDRASAMKSLEMEQRKAKKDAREKALADESAARQKLAEEAREAFLDEKRDEIRKLNDNSHELTEDVIESLTDEEILDFDEDFKADFEALPGPDTFTKAQVLEMVARMHEEAAFETDNLRVLSLEEVIERDKMQLEEMEGQLLGFGGEDALNDDSLDRETLRSIDRLRKDIEKAKNNLERLPELREKAMEGLKDAMADGTIKVLRTAITAAKRAKLQGQDEETGGIWAVDLLRDAALELEKAKQNKKVADAQKELVAKRNKCFIRTEPLGRDRFGNRFWTFDHGEDGHVWVDSEYTLKDDSAQELDRRHPPRFLDMKKSPEDIQVGAQDMEEDFIDDDTPKAEFEKFSRQEYHSTGFSASLVKNHWGCQTTEESLRGVIKHLDSKNAREQELKTQLKEAVENKVGANEKPEALVEEKNDAADDEAGNNTEPRSVDRFEGDEEQIQKVKEEKHDGEDINFDGLPGIHTAIGRRVRVRTVVSETKDNALAKYETGTVVAWKMFQVERKVTPDESEEEELDAYPRIEVVDVPQWKVLTDRGHQYWLNGDDLLKSVSRFEKLEKGQTYYEQDAVFLGYRNSLGKHCGRPSDAAYASSPITFARLMVKRESDLYPKLKIRSYDNSWGGKSGDRALWTNSMKDYAFDLVTVRQGLLRLEQAFFDLTGEWSEYENVNLDEEPNAKAIMEDPATRNEIELESIEKSIPGLWNSPASRAVYIEIVSNAKTTSFLALALDLLCRNTMKYLQKHKLHNVRTQTYTDDYLPPRTTRRRNAWQQATHDDWF